MEDLIGWPSRAGDPTWALQALSENKAKQTKCFPINFITRTEIIITHPSYANSLISWQQCKLSSSFKTFEMHKNGWYLDVGESPTPRIAWPGDYVGLA